MVKVSFADPGLGDPPLSTALYFPIAVCFMAVTQGINLGVGDYVIVGLLSTLATLGASPIPGSALVFVVMICKSQHFMIFWPGRWQKGCK